MVENKKLVSEYSYIIEYLNKKKKNTFYINY